MRAEILNYINTQSLGGFLLSQEYPWIDSGTSTLYIKNPKKIYVDAVEYSNEPFIQTLGSLNINNETSTVRIYFACDAKQIPSNYDTLVNSMKAAKDITTIEGIQRPQCDVTTEME